MKKYFYLILIILINSCSENIEKKPNEATLKLIAHKTSLCLCDAYIIIPGFYNNKKEDIFISAGIFEDFVYKKFYKAKYKDFGLFLIDIIYEKIKLTGEIYEYFKDDIIFETKIYQDYKKNGLNYVKEKYLIKTNQSTNKNSIFIEKVDLSIDEEKDLIRVLFYNSYIITLSDLDGKYRFILYTKK